jgi:hypothetical protein
MFFGKVIPHNKETYLSMESAGLHLNLFFSKAFSHKFSCLHRKYVEQISGDSGVVTSSKLH